MLILPDRLSHEAQVQAEQRYMAHAVKSPWGERDRINLASLRNKETVSNEELLRRYRNRLICPKCEQQAYRTSKTTARCANPRCGNYEAEFSSITVDEYLTEKLYRR